MSELPPITERESKDLKEAYLTAMLGEVVYLRKQLNHILEESSCRIGMTQDIIENHLNSAKEAVDKYVLAANAHFAKTRSDLKEVAANELRESVTRSLVDAHKQLLLANPPRMSLRNMLSTIIIAGVFAGVVGVGSGLLTFQLSGEHRLTQEELQLIDNGRTLEQVWSQLSESTRKEIKAAIKK